jgi:hypothetical protein
MPNWSSHLPRVGALVLSAAIAAGAYGVYTGQPSSSVNSSGESVADVPSLSIKPEAGLPSHGGAKPAQDQAERPPSGHAGEGPGFATGVSAAQPPPSSHSVEPEVQAVERDARKPATPRAIPPKPNRPLGDDDALDRELQRVIDQGLPVAPKSPPSDDKPVDGTPVTDDPVDLIEEPGAPEPGTQPEPVEEPQTTPAAPGSEAPPAAPEAPPVGPANPAAPVDDTGMDDTAAGGLDDTDLGAPVDETDQGVEATTPPAPAGDATPPAPAADATPPAPPNAG